MFGVNEEWVKQYVDNWHSEVQREITAVKKDIDGLKQMIEDNKKILDEPISEMAELKKKVTEMVQLMMMIAQEKGLVEKPKQETKIEKLQRLMNEAK
jgi:phage regulator Rha-like protein